MKEGWRHCFKATPLPMNNKQVPDDPTAHQQRRIYMKTDLVKDNAISLGSILENIRKQGDSKVSKPLFNVICAVVAVSFIVTVVLLSNVGIDFIESHYGKDMWLIGLLFISLLIGMGARYFLRMCLQLWRFTKEE